MKKIYESADGLYFKHFQKEAPQNVKSLEKIIEDKKRKKIERKERMQKEGEGQHR
jgi:hypothetical protein